ncbi:MAG: hypothetical protein IKW53_04825 [Clostridia bacterium]|nr:hypothetical protein [Clostridia bacterium]
MKFTRSQKEFAKKVIAIVLAFGVIIGCVSLVSGLGEDDQGYKTINPTFSVGAISADTGSYVDDECAIYTKEAIECTAIKLSADFDSDIKYEVHFYDEDDSWISSVENGGLNSYFDCEANGNPFHAVRIVIYPQSDENGKVSLLEKFTYANQLTIKITNKAINN